jgi:hypothetical protein
MTALPVITDTRGALDSMLVPAARGGHEVTGGRQLVLFVRNRSRRHRTVVIEDVRGEEVRMFAIRAARRPREEPSDMMIGPMFPYGGEVRIRYPRPGGLWVAAFEAPA